MFVVREETVLAVHMVKSLQSLVDLAFESVKKLFVPRSCYTRPCSSGSVLVEH